MNRVLYCDIKKYGLHKNMIQKCIDKELLDPVIRKNIDNTIRMRLKRKDKLSLLYIINNEIKENLTNELLEDIKEYLYMNFYFYGNYEYFKNSNFDDRALRKIIKEEVDIVYCI